MFLSFLHVGNIVIKLTTAHFAGIFVDLDHACTDWLHQIVYISSQWGKMKGFHIIKFISVEQKKQFKWLIITFIFGELSLDSGKT